MKRIAMVVASLTMAGGLALAQTPEKVAEEWFNKGTTAYNLGRFDDAVTNFTKAYEAWPQPEFLYNIAQSYRLAGNCKQALHFYKRFKSLKKDLSAKKLQEIDRFIEQLTECAAQADASATTQPDTVDQPPKIGTTTTGTPTTGTTGTPATGTTGTTTTSTTGTTPTTSTTGTQVAAVDGPDDGRIDDGPGVSASADTTAPRLVSARMSAGIAVLGSGDLEMPVQPSVGITGGYPLALGALTLELGAGLSWSPLPYETAAGQQQGNMLGVRAVVAAVYPVAPKISLRGELGVGIISMSGLQDGNPLSEMRDAGGITLPSVRVGVAAEYAITPNIVGYLSPFGFAFAPGNDRLYGSNVREINVLLGVGYRQ